MNGLRIREGMAWHGEVERKFGQSGTGPDRAGK